MFRLTPAIVVLGLAIILLTFAPAGALPQQFDLPEDAIIPEARNGTPNSLTKAILSTDGVLPERLTKGGIMHGVSTSLIQGTSAARDHRRHSRRRKRRHGGRHRRSSRRAQRISRRISRQAQRISSRAQRRINRGSESRDAPSPSGDLQGQIVHEIDQDVQQDIKTAANIEGASGIPVDPEDDNQIANGIDDDTAHIIEDASGIAKLRGSPSLEWAEKHPFNVNPFPEGSGQGSGVGSGHGHAIPAASTDGAAPLAMPRLFVHDKTQSFIHDTGSFGPEGLVYQSMK